MPVGGNKLDSFQVHSFIHSTDSLKTAYSFRDETSGWLHPNVHTFRTIKNSN